MVATIIGWIFAGLGILLLILLLCPLIVGLSYRDEVFTVTVRILGFIKLRLLPAREKDEAKEEKKARRKSRKKKKKEEAEEKKPRRKRSLQQWLYLIKRIANAAGAAKNILLAGLRIYDFTFILAIHEEEASDTAIRYGQVQAAVGAARAVLENLIKIRYKTLVVIPDFEGREKQSPIFSCKVAVCPVIMLVAGIVGLRAFLRFRKVYGREPLSREQKKELEERREKLRAEREEARQKQQQAAPPDGKTA